MAAATKEADAEKKSILTKIGMDSIGIEVRVIDDCIAVCARKGFGAGHRIFSEQTSIVFPRKGSDDEFAHLLGKLAPAMLAPLAVLSPRSAGSSMVEKARRNGIATTVPADRLALFFLASLFNHSCTPNIGFVATPTPGGGARIEMIAYRDIAVGDELCHSYKDLDGLLRAQRHAVLGFACLCPLCTTGADTPLDATSYLLLNSQWMFSPLRRLPVLDITSKLPSLQAAIQRALTR